MKTRDEVLVGLLVTAAIVVTVLGSLWLARGGLSKGYPLYAKFPWGAGLKQGQPVLLVGVAVGYLDQVDLHQDGTLVTTLRIQKHYQVPVTSKAAVVPNGIFGDMAVALPSNLRLLHFPTTGHSCRAHLQGLKFLAAFEKPSSSPTRVHRVRDACPGLQPRQRVASQGPCRPLQRPARVAPFVR